MEQISKNELLDEIIIILMAALSLAGVRDDCMKQALEAYEDLIDEISDDEEYDYKAICKVINRLKKTRGELFG
ncbi:hypothetical protein [Helicobacter sp. MIT 99-5507]|uniref:hypothetical protein n=1 Tax=Helicobacter sp. MIT 99-5507 TaxID=152489 RepID=UPI000E1F7936|nr:hypothetical protein [Helicobacter sp. MIT 99-5507]RDU57259.1 hypothetical protein CQA42_04730 [Helicobacter sp. MIT 99-5507]